MGLNDYKTALKAALETVGPTYDHLPSSFTPPALFLVEGDPYLEHVQGNRFQEYRVNYSLVLMVKSGTNAVMAQALNELLDSALGVLEGLDWHIGPVDGFSLETVNGNQYLATSLELSNTYRRNN